MFSPLSDQNVTTIPETPNASAVPEAPNTSFVDDHATMPLNELEEGNRLSVDVTWPLPAMQPPNLYVGLL
jgi:hypothetical protein